ncbi:MAG: NAD(P)/FAD-dependent oxidoreductase [Oscillospiraceae bacterium]|nr:NAD(P)/FAD-dependent oxidoreductase [Oscillospiraceae bacterium]
MKQTDFDTLIVGGGAAGMMAAITAAEQGCRVRLLEKNDRPGRKLYITGKGRCNLTNDCPVQTVLENIPTNPKFLYSALRAFPPQRTMEYFTALGVPLKVERGKRVFPVSDRAADVIDALRNRMRELRVQYTCCTVRELLSENGRVVGVRTNDADYFAPTVLLATGGVSYPRTGSTGDGYTMARSVGHTITPLTGSLVPLEEDGSLCAQLDGLTLKNVAVRLQNAAGKTVYEDFGEAVFTPFGLDGPTILSCSAHMGTADGFTVVFDLKPALSEETLDAKLLRIFREEDVRTVSAALRKMLPRQLISPILHLAELPFSQQKDTLSREARKRLIASLKHFPIRIRGKRPPEEAIVTSGGISVREVDPKTMESKKLRGLYLAGELLDIDAYTGGFNLQIAWATGYAAGNAIAAAKKERESI